MQCLIEKLSAIWACTENKKLSNWQQKGCKHRCLKQRRCCHSDPPDNLLGCHKQKKLSIGCHTPQKTTQWQLFDNSWQCNDNSLTTPDNVMTTIWQLFDSFLTTKKLSGRSEWQLFVVNLTTFCCQFDNFMFLVENDNLLTTYCGCDNHMTTSCCLGQPKDNPKGCQAGLIDNWVVV